MAATQLDELSVKFTADIAGLRAGLEKIEVATLKMSATTERATAKMSSGFATLGRYLTAGAIIAGIRAISAYQDKLDALGSELIDVSGRANVGVEALQRLRFAADQNGSSAEDMDKALVKLQRSMGEAAGGSKELQQDFKALGLIDLVKSGATTDQMLLGLADALKQVKNPMLEAAIAQKLMGKTADTLVPALRGGSDAFQAMADAMPAVAVKSDELAHKLDSMHDATVAFQQKLDGLTSWLEGGFIDGFNAATDAMEAFGKQMLALDSVIAGQERQRSGFPNLDDIAGLTDYGAPKAPDVGGSDSSAITKGVARRKQPQKVSGLGAFFDPSAANEADSAKKRIDQIIKSLENEKAAFGLTSDQIRINEELLRAHGAATVEDTAKITALVTGISDLQRVRELDNLEVQNSAAQYERVQQIIDENKTAAQRYAEAVRELNQLHDSGKLPLDEWALALKRVAETMDPVTQAFDQMGERFADLTADAIVNGQSLKEVFGQILQEIEKAIIKETILKALGQSGGDGGILDSVISAAGSIIGGFAMGGGASPGNSYLVGEHGPELFQPNVGGSIVPSNRIGGSGSFSYSPTIIASGNNKAQIRQMLDDERKHIFGMMNKFVSEQSARGRLKMN